MLHWNQLLTDSEKLLELELDALPLVALPPVVFPDTVALPVLAFCDVLLL